MAAEEKMLPKLGLESIPELRDATVMYTVEPTENVDGLKLLQEVAILKSLVEEGAKVTVVVADWCTFMGSKMPMEVADAISDIYVECLRLAGLRELTIVRQSELVKKNPSEYLQLALGVAGAHPIKDIVGELGQNEKQGPLGSEVLITSMHCADALALKPQFVLLSKEKDNGFLETGTIHFSEIQPLQKPFLRPNVPNPKAFIRLTDTQAQIEKKISGAFLDVTKPLESVFGMLIPITRSFADTEELATALERLMDGSLHPLDFKQLVGKAVGTLFQPIVAVLESDAYKKYTALLPGKHKR